MYGVSEEYGTDLEIWMEYGLGLDFDRIRIPSTDSFLSLRFALDLKMPTTNNKSHKPNHAKIRRSDLICYSNSNPHNPCS